MVANTTWIKSGIIVIVYMCVNNQRNIMCTEKIIFATCSCKNSKYLGSIIDDSVIMCDEVINVGNYVSTNVTSAVSTYFFNKKVR